MATPQNKVFVGDVGTVIFVNTKSDISGATTLELLIKKPSGKEETWPGVLDGNSRIKYTINDGDFSEPGDYHLQAYVELPTWKGRGETVVFHVYDKFEE